MNRQYSQQQQPNGPANRMQDHTLCWRWHLCQCNTTDAYQNKESQIHSAISHTFNVDFWCLSTNKSSAGEEHQAVYCIKDATDGGEVRTSLTSLVMGMAGGTRGLLPSSSRVKNSILFSSSHSAYDPISRYLLCRSISQTTACSQHLWRRCRAHWYEYRMHKGKRMLHGSDSACCVCPCVCCIPHHNAPHCCSVSCSVG